MMGEGAVVDPLPNSHAGALSLVSCPKLIFNIFATILHI
jgi:hypothetical protein